MDVMAYVHILERDKTVADPGKCSDINKWRTRIDNHRFVAILF